MANIKVNDIKPAGADLFGDYESYMDELVDSEINNIKGGRASGVQVTVVASCACQAQR
ncbi:hypothetical protein [Nostoc sp. WHI]|uniref:hypothetical protein n=1 Tax=Nostoc sp. WHI TaxID=2650611 RepID=UPI0018C63895|nr:hypothetical protein [Nostoc sp. WHI]